MNTTPPQTLIPVAPAPTIRTAALDECMRNRVTGLSRNVRKHDRWFSYCAAEMAAREAGTVNTVKRPQIPSKEAKHRAYDDARSLQRYLSITAPTGVHGTRAEWQWTLDKAREAGL